MQVTWLSTFMQRVFHQLNTPFSIQLRKKILTWPSLTPSLIQKHLVLPQSTILEHIKREKHSPRSTKPQLKQNVPNKNPTKQFTPSFKTIIRLSWILQVDSHTNHHEVMNTF